MPENKAAKSLMPLLFCRSNVCVGGCVFVLQCAYMHVLILKGCVLFISALPAVLDSILDVVPPR